MRLLALMSFHHEAEKGEMVPFSVLLNSVQEDGAAFRPGSPQFTLPANALPVTPQV